MITHLHLQNFLRHEDSELHFDPSQQLVVIDGANGAGKTSLLRAVSFALYGDSPSGIRIDELVRRGAELEGCQVDLTFTIGEDSYQVRRRRDGNKSSAILHVNDAPVVEGASAVTEEITRVLGMDAAGFKVAFMAEQGELDGLASLRPGERAKMLSRLLRLDAIEAAKLKAREIYNNQRRVVHALGTGLDLDELAVALEEAIAERELLEGQLAEARGAVARLDESIAQGTQAEAEYQAAVEQANRVRAQLEAARGEHARLVAAHDALEVGEPVVLGEQSAEQLAEQLRQLEAELVRAESAAELGEQRRMALREAKRCDERIDQIDQTVEQLRSVMSLAAASAALDEAAAQRSAAAEELEELGSQLSEQRTRAQMATTRLHEIQELGATCRTCGQDVDEEHRDEELAAARQRQQDAEGRIEQLEAQRAEVAEQLEAAEAALAAAHDARGEATRAQSRLAELAEQRAELARRRDTYTANAERLPAGEVDVDQLYERKGELALAHSEAQAAEQAVAERERKLERRDDLAEQVAQAATRVEQAQQALAAAEPSEQLADAHSRLAEDKAARDDERELVAHLAAEHAGAVERARSAERELDRAQETLDRRRRHQNKAQTAENASRLLGEVGEILTTQIRPALQGAVSDLLGRLSEGRFSEAHISDTYDVQVVDDGDVVDLASLSGGEQDLVALAVRLALAEVVTARQGAGGIGTVVLDEVFGSQDSSRQTSIISALRGLRDVYGQILLISHVGGLDEHADTVVTVSTSPDRATTEVYMA